ncbi:MAG: YciI family protein [Gemmatimonadales bacterium]|nr:YciI family protein [Gemmatimonadales bacterium]MBA3554047.1 YciI family protein [Gemmatimonadales bacterium]
MKYLCLIYSDEKLVQAMPSAQWDALVSEHVDYDEELRRSGHFIASEALQAVQTATVIRVRNGRLATTDGPYAETKEQLGGFYLIEARDLNEAIQVASRIPSARLGGIEVRPIMELEQPGSRTTIQGG